MLIHVIITLLGIVEAICGVLLVAIILLQKSRSHGAAAGLAFGAGMGESLFGAQATNVLQKITVVLATVFLVNTTLLAFLGSRRHREGGRSVTDSLPSAPIEATTPGQGQGMPMGGPVSPVATPAAPEAAVPPSGAAAEPVKVDTPAPAAVPAQATDTDQKPAQP